MSVDVDKAIEDVMQVVTDSPAMNSAFVAQRRQEGTDAARASN